MRKIGEAGIAHILMIIILLAGIAGGLMLIKNPAIFKPRASGPPGIRVSPCAGLGDVDNDGYVTSADAQAVLKIVAKLDPYKNPTEDQLRRANVDTRNNNVTSVDSLMIKGYAAGLDNTFRACAQTTREIREIKVWLLQHIPPGGIASVYPGVNMDPVGFTKNTLIPAMNEASKYKGYSNPAAQPALKYDLDNVNIKTENNPPPLSSGKYDYASLFRRYDLCNYAKANNIKAIFLWMSGSGAYGGGYTEESAITGNKGIRTNGPALSNLCDKTIVIYAFNYTRDLDVALETYGHHLEAVFRQFRPEYAAWADEAQNIMFQGPWFPQVTRGDSCGIDHDPPNARFEYDRSNTASYQSDCRNWKPDGTGAKETLNCNIWGCSVDGWLKWWMQNMPGLGNTLVGSNGQKIPNWWVYIRDPDNCYNNALGCSGSTDLTPSPTPTLTPSPMPSPTPSPSSSPNASRLTATTTCSGPDLIASSNHVDIVINGTIFPPDSNTFEGVWLTATDQLFNTTIFMSYFGYRSFIGQLSVNSSYHDLIINIRGSALKLIGDGRTYVIKAYLGPYTSGTPTLTNPFYQTSFSASCTLASPSPTPSPLPTPQTAAKRVFVTSATYNGNLGGLPNADFKCQIRAEEANLGGEWKAWLSDNATSAASRLNHNNGPYKLINGTIVANNWEDLTDGSLQNPIKITELGTEQGIETWTNTLATSSIPSSSRSCSNWTSSYDDSGSLIQIRGGGLAGGVVGNPNSFSQAWSNSTTASCNSDMSLYCFEQ